MTTKRKVEIFTAGCAVCDETVSKVKALACPSCEIVTLDMRGAPKSWACNPSPPSR